jgi:hypothetical protein
MMTNPRPTLRAKCARYTGTVMTLENMRQQGVCTMACHSLFAAIALIMAKGRYALGFA